MSDMSIQEIERIAIDLESHARDCQHWIDRAEHYGKTPKIQLHEDGLRSSEAASALRQLMNEQKWRDIASAPMDGTEILGWREDCGTIIVRWSCAVEFMTDREIEESGMDDEALHALDWFAADFIHGCRLEGDEVPTYWLPLPSPPETSDV